MKNNSYFLTGAFPHSVLSIVHVPTVHDTAFKLHIRHYYVKNDDFADTEKRDSINVKLCPCGCLHFEMDVHSFSGG